MLLEIQDNLPVLLVNYRLNTNIMLLLKPEGNVKQFGSIDNAHLTFRDLRANINDESVF